MQASLFNWLRKAKSPLVGFLCMVLIVNIGAPVAFAASNSFSLGAAGYGPGTLFCTSKGYQWVSFTDLGVDKPAPPQNLAQGGHCEFCLNIGDDIDQLRGVFSAQKIVVTRSNFSLGFYSVSILNRTFSSPNSRAPPLVLA